MSLTFVDWFCGAGGSSQGAVSVPGVVPHFAANHWKLAIESHAVNFPDAEHHRGDLHDCDLESFPSGDIFWASPECTKWTQARGKKRNFNQPPGLFGDPVPDEAEDRSRALMWDVPRYLAAMQLRGQPVKAGVVENVIDERDWIRFDEWVGSIRNLGYRTRLIAFNSMHAQPARTRRAPQSRDRLYLAYWLTSLGRDPDWDKWLRPAAWCPSCDQMVLAVQAFKRPGVDMGRYGAQYVYRCPKVSCRGQVVTPEVLPAAAIIDWTNLGKRIGDRDRPLSVKTLARIEAGLRKYATPITLEAAGNTFERRPGVRTRPVADPLTTLQATATKGFASLPMIVPAGGTWNDTATGVDEPLRTRTTRETDALACPPFVTILRGKSLNQPVLDPLGAITAKDHHGLVHPPFLTVLRSGRPRTIGVDEPTATIVADGSAHYLCAPPMVMRNLTARGDPGQMLTPVDEPARTMTASGTQSLVVPPLLMRNNRGGAEMSTPVTEPARTMTTKGHQSLLVPYYGTGVARPVDVPAGTLGTRDRHALATGEPIDVMSVRFRMLQPAEVGGAMAFYPDYVVLGNRTEQVRQYGNAVTPPVAEVIVSALVEAVTGEPAT